MHHKVNEKKMTTIQNLPNAIAAFLPLCGVVFYAGVQSHRIDELFSKVHAYEKTQDDLYDTIFDIHGRVCSIENSVKEVHTKLHELQSGRDDTQ